MRAFGTLRIATVIAILLFSLAESMPNKAYAKQEQSAQDYADDGEYDEESTFGNDDDDPAQPAVSSAPVKSRSENMTIVAMPGDTVEFPCVLDNAEDTVITWYRDSQVLFFGSVRSISDLRFSRADNFSLILTDVTEKDASNNYSCHIMVKPIIVVVHKLIVDQKPRELSHVIRVTPAKVVKVGEGESVTFGCETKNDLKSYAMIWSHKGERVRSDQTIEANGNFVTIKKATRHHAGGYQCLVENNTDKPPHDAIEVIVSYSPEIEVEHGMVHTGPGMKSELTCIVHAHPHAKVTWRKNGKKIVEKNGRKLFADDKSRRTLIIEHTNQHDFGQYTCTAKNDLGESSKQIELTGVPSRPRFYSAEIAADESSLIFKWHVESYAPITEYKLDYRRTGDSDWMTVSPRVTNGRGNQFTAEHALERLEPGSWEARLQARNEYGWSGHSNLHTFREEYRLGKSDNVKGSAVTSRPIVGLTAFLILVVSSYGLNFL